MCLPPQKMSVRRTIKSRVPIEPEFKIVVEKTTTTMKATLYQHDRKVDDCLMEATKDAIFNFGVFHMKSKRPEWDELEFVFDEEEGYQFYAFHDRDEYEREYITDFVVLIV